MLTADLLLLDSPPGDAQVTLLEIYTHQRALSVIRKRYIDFASTFVYEKLIELHHVHFSVETLRKWMIKGGLWSGRQRKKASIHQSRPRQLWLSELVQADGPPHVWFLLAKFRLWILYIIQQHKDRFNIVGHRGGKVFINAFDQTI